MDCLQACWLKKSVDNRSPETCACTGAKPFVPANATGGAVTINAGYAGLMNHTVQSPDPFFTADVGVLGLTRLSKCGYPEPHSASSALFSLP